MAKARHFTQYPVKLNRTGKVHSDRDSLMPLPLFSGFHLKNKRLQMNIYVMPNLCVGRQLCLGPFPQLWLGYKGKNSRRSKSRLSLSKSKTCRWHSHRPAPTTHANAKHTYGKTYIQNHMTTRADLRM